MDKKKEAGQKFVWLTEVVIGGGIVSVDTGPKSFIIMNANHNNL